MEIYCAVAQSYGGRWEIAFVFKKRLEEDAKALNTDVVRVDKDLFKAGVATRHLPVPCLVSADRYLLAFFLHR